MRQALSDCEAYPCPSYASSTLGARCSSVCQLLRPCVHVTVCSLLFILSSALGQVEKGAQAQPLRQTSPGTSIRMSLLRGDTGSGSLTATSSVDARRQGASSSHVETRTVGQHNAGGGSAVVDMSYSTARKIAQAPGDASTDPGETDIPEED